MAQWHKRVVTVNATGCGFHSSGKRGLASKRSLWSYLIMMGFFEFGCKKCGVGFRHALGNVFIYKF